MKPHYEKVTVIAPARLHMGFIDLSGALGRHFGSIGLGLNDINTQLTLRASDTLSAKGPGAERALKSARHLCSVLQLSEPVDISIACAIPEHVGLGSGTQMSLALGMALSALYGLDLSVRDIARLTERGARSGIGIGVFEQGGLVVDGGRGLETETPPLLSRMPVPENWRFILAFDSRGQGLHGEQEVSAFKRLPPFPRSEAERLCYLLLMQALPALAEHNLVQFGEVITELQESVGRHFAPVQGGVFTSSEVAAAMGWLRHQGAVAIGQTSWGPTGFCAIDGPARANELLSELQRRFGADHLSFMVASARNLGADVIRQ
ncbi:MAG: GHMP kinase [Methylomonas sp.]|nr:GHMP kinase [Methylomonas sp.]